MDYQIKVAVVGEYSTGKSSLVSRLCEKLPEENYTNDVTVPTVGVGFHPKQMDIFLQPHSSANRLKVNLFVWDTNGSEKYLSMVKPYFRDNAFVVIVFDVTNRKSFERVDFWRQQVLDNDSRADKPKGLPLFCLIGSKGDLQTATTNVENGDFVCDREISEKANEWGCPWWVVSSIKPFDMRGTKTPFVGKLHLGLCKIELFSGSCLSFDAMLPTEQTVTIFAHMTLEFHKLLKTMDFKQLTKTCCSLGQMGMDNVSMTYSDRKRKIDIEKKEGSCC